MLQRPTPFDLDGFLASHPEVHPDKIVVRKAPALPEPNRPHDAYSQARRWIATIGPAISGQGGAGRTFGVAYALLKGFCLHVHEAKSLLAEWNLSCQPPWSQYDLDRKLHAADEAPDEQPRGYKLNRSAFDGFQVEIEPMADPPRPDEPPQPRRHSHISDDPASIAARFIEANMVEESSCTYRWYIGQFYKYNGSFYDKLHKDIINADLSDFIEAEFLRRYVLDCAEVPAEDQHKVVKRKFTNALAENVKTCLINHILINTEESEPFWLRPGPDGWSPQDLIPAANRLVHLPSFVQDKQPSHIDRTPKLFSTYSLKYDFKFDRYIGPVQPPPVWRGFLESVFPDDPESVDCLQEIFGYSLTCSTYLQKIFMMIGPKRSGKGTIIRTMRHMLGERNVCFPTFKSLTTQFGKQQLIGKMLAIFPDARITGRTDTSDVVECLLSISGEDPQTIDRKFLDPLDAKLTCRFVVSSNELPRLTENSGALFTRFIVLKFDETFIGNEDIELETKLTPEIPHILRWSIDGWARLAERKRFLQPANGQQAVDDFLHLSSPIQHFLSEGADIEPSYSTDTRALYNAYRTWCQYQGRENIGDMSNFIRNLKAAQPMLKFGDQNITHNGDGQAWARLVSGIRVRPLIDEWAAYGSNGNGNGNGMTNGHPAAERYPQVEF